MVKRLKKFNFHDCIREGLLRNIPPSKGKAERSIRAAEKWLKEAENGLKSGSFNSSLISSYLAMFHSARAILFYDGIRERSHYCIARYLEEKYVKKRKLESKWVDLLDHYRDMRHNDQYDMDFFVTDDECKNALETAKRFALRIKDLLEKIKLKS